MENVKSTKLADMNQLDLFVKETRKAFAEISMKKECVKELVEWLMRNVSMNLPTQATIIKEDDKDICEIALNMTFLWEKPNPIFNMYMRPHCKLREILEKEDKVGSDAFYETYNLVQDYFRGKDVAVRQYKDNDTRIVLAINISSKSPDTLSPSSDPLKNLIYKAREYMRNRVVSEECVNTIMEEFFKGVNNGSNRPIEIHDDVNCGIYATFKIDVNSMSEESKNAFKGLGTMIVQEIADVTNYGRNMRVLFTSYLKESNVRLCQFEFSDIAVIELGIAFDK